MTTNKEDGYNGWPNYETWAVALWLDNEEGSCNYWAERAQEAWDDAEPGKYEWQTREAVAKDAIADALKEAHEEHQEELGLCDGGKTGVFADLMNAALSEVDWHEIAAHYLDEVTKDATA